MDDKIRILIADDTAIAREGLKRLLSGTSEIEIVGEAANIISVLTKTKELQPDIILLDLKWFGDETAGISVIDTLLQNSPKTKILAMTVYDHLVTKAREAGAHIAITKDFSRDQLVEYIRDLYKGGDLLQARPHNPKELQLTEPLTEREKDVLNLMAEGLPDREIAERLVIALNTEKNHVQSILGKMGVENRTRAVVVALKMSLVGNQSHDQHSKK